MNWYGWRISFGTPADFNNKPDVAEECLALSLKARFPTDYTDVYEHLFGNDDYIICILYNNEGDIMGYSIFANLKEIDMLYLHGIVLHPLAQGKGYSNVSQHRTESKNFFQKFQLSVASRSPLKPHF